MLISQSIKELNGLSKGIALDQKGEKLQFVESFSSFLKELDKKCKFKIFPGSSFNPLSPASSWEWLRGLQWVEPPAIYLRGWSAQKKTLL